MTYTREHWMSDPMATVPETPSLGTVAVTEGEVVDFARPFHPRPLHVDKASAEMGPFEG